MYRHYRLNGHNILMHQKVEVNKNNYNDIEVVQNDTNKDVSSLKNNKKRAHNVSDNKIVHHNNIYGLDIGRWDSCTLFAEQ